MPFSRRIFTAPLLWTSSCPIIPSTFGTTGVVSAVGVGVEALDGDAAFTSGAKVTFLPLSTGFTSELGSTICWSPVL